MLVVAPLSGHHSTLLRDTVQTMLRDHKVYITDWKNARNVPLSEGEFHLDDYVNYVQDFIRHVQNIYGNCHVMSVCQPTVPVLAAVSLMASRGELTPLSMTMMGGPIDARKSPTSVNDLAMNKSHNWFESNVIYRVPSSFPGAGRRVYPGFLQHSGFMAMNPNNHAQSHYDYFQDLIKGDDASTEAHRKFYDEYNAVLDMDADFYLDTIKVVFQDFSLVNGTWDVRSPERQDRACAPAGHHEHRPVLDRRRTGRHFRFRPDRGRARHLQRRARVACKSISRSRALATTASSPAGAGAKWCIRRSRRSSRSTSRTTRLRSQRRRRPRQNRLLHAPQLELVPSSAPSAAAKPEVSAVSAVPARNPVKKAAPKPARKAAAPRAARATAKAVAAPAADAPAAAKAPRAARKAAARDK